MTWIALAIVFHAFEHLYCYMSSARREIAKNAIMGDLIATQRAFAKTQEEATRLQARHVGAHERFVDGALAPPQDEEWKRGTEGGE